MARIVHSKEVPFSGLQRIITYVGSTYDDPAFGQLLDGMWRAYRANPDIPDVYRFGATVVKYAEYKISGSKGSYGLQIWMHDRVGNRMVFEVINGSRVQTALLSFVDVDERMVGTTEVLDLMWQAGISGGFEETFTRFGVMATR